MTQVLHLPSQWNKLLVYLLISIQSFVSIVAEFRLNFEKFSISPLQAYSFRCWFSNNSIITFLEGCFPTSLVAKLSFSSPSLYPNGLTSILSLRRHCDVVLFTHHLVLWGPCSFRAYPFPTGVSCPLFKFFPFCQVFLPSQPECCLKSFLPLVSFFH